MGSNPAKSIFIFALILYFSALLSSASSHWLTGICSFFLLQRSYRKDLFDDASKHMQKTLNKPEVINHYIALHFIALHCVTLHCILLHCVASTRKAWLVKPSLPTLMLPKMADIQAKYIYKLLVD